MKNNNRYIISFICAVLNYAAAAIYFFTGERKASAIVYFCLGSALLCLGAAQLNSYRKEKNKKDDQ